MSKDNFFQQKHIIQNFQRVVAHYDEATFLNQEIARRLIERLELMRIQPKIILELGSATGYCTRLLEQKYPKAKIIGLDLVTDMLQQARKQKRWLSKQRFVCADAQHLPFLDSSVDLIVSNLMFSWCTDLPLLFANIKRILKPQGLFLFSMFGPNTFQEMRSSWTKLDEYPHVQNFIDMHDIGDMLMAQRFLDPVMDMEMLTITYQQMHKLFQDLKNTGMNNLLQNRRKTLTGKNRYKNFIEAYQKLANDTNLLPLSYEIIYGHAWAPVMKMVSAADKQGEVRVSVKDILKNNQ